MYPILLCMPQHCFAHELIEPIADKSFISFTVSSGNNLRVEELRLSHTSHLLIPIRILEVFVDKIQLYKYNWQAPYNM